MLLWVIGGHQTGMLGAESLVRDSGATDNDGVHWALLGAEHHVRLTPKVGWSRSPADDITAQATGLRVPHTH